MGLSGPQLILFTCCLSCTPPPPPPPLPALLSTHKLPPSSQVSSSHTQGVVQTHTLTLLRLPLLFFSLYAVLQQEALCWAMGGLQCIKYLVFIFNFLFWVRSCGGNTTLVLGVKSEARCRYEELSTVSERSPGVCSHWSLLLIFSKIITLFSF